MRNAYQFPRLNEGTSLWTKVLRVACSAGLAFVFAWTAPGAQAGDSSRARLDPPAEPLDSTTFRAVGFDSAGPRPLVLWHFDGNRYLRLAQTHSSSDGRFDFGLFPLPLSHAEFGVTEPGEAPNEREFRHYERVVPAPVVVAQDSGEGLLRVLTSRAEGELRIYDHDTMRLLARMPIATLPQREVSIDLMTALPRIWPRAIAIEHILADGRPSAQAVWRLEQQGPDAR